MGNNVGQSVRQNVSQISSHVTWRSLTPDERRATCLDGQEVLELGELVQLAPARERRAAARRERMTAPPVRAGEQEGTPRRHRQRWSDDEEAWLQQRLDEGADYATVAAELGRTRRACFQRAYVKTMVVGPDACLNCGKSVVQPSVGAKRNFCSELCSRHHLHPPREVPSLLVCPNCNTAFTPRDARQLYCTRACSTAASHVRHLAEVAEALRIAGVGDGVSPTRGKPLVGEHATQVILLHAQGHSLRQICRLTGFGFRQVRSCVATIPATFPAQTPAETPAEPPVGDDQQLR